MLKDGEKVDTLDSKGLTEDELKRLMVGREIKETYFYTPAKNENAEPVLVADGITVDGVLHNVSFELRRGEVLGLGGLSDSGIHELGKVLFGLTRADQGQVIFADTGERIDSLRKAINSGSPMCPRDTEALMVRARSKTISSAFVDAFVGPLGFPQPAQEKEIRGFNSWKLLLGSGSVAVTAFAVDRQKVSLAQWLSSTHKIITWTSPTRGVEWVLQPTLQLIAR